MNAQTCKTNLERKKASCCINIQFVRSPETEKPQVPLAGDELDGEEEDDTLERCGGCRRGMKNGAVRSKLSISVSAGRWSEEEMRTVRWEALM